MKHERTARELPGAFVRHVIKVHVLEGGVHGGGEGGTSEALETRVEEEVLAGGQGLPQQVVLRADTLQRNSRALFHTSTVESAQPSALTLTEYRLSNQLVNGADSHQHESFKSSRPRM